MSAVLKRRLRTFGKKVDWSFSKFNETIIIASFFNDVTSH